MNSKKPIDNVLSLLRVSESKFAFIDQLETPVAEWKNILLKGNKRNFLMKMENPDVEGLIELPKLENKGDWTKKFKTRIKKAENMILISDSIIQKFNKLTKLASKNKYTLEIYERVNELVNLTPRLIILLKLFDQSKRMSKGLLLLQK